MKEVIKHARGDYRMRRHWGRWQIERRWLQHWEPVGLPMSYMAAYGIFMELRDWQFMATEDMRAMMRGEIPPIVTAEVSAAVESMNRILKEFDEQKPRAGRASNATEEVPGVPGVRASLVCGPARNTCASPGAEEEGEAGAGIEDSGDELADEEEVM